MVYESKRLKITRSIRSVIAGLKESAVNGNVVAICSNMSINLGVKEKDVSDVLETFERAGEIEITKGEVIV